MFITGMSATNLRSAITISVRYSAVRRQFGLPGQPEQPVLDYELQQWRLMPLLAAAYATDNFQKSFFMDFVELQMGMMTGDKSARSAAALATPPCLDMFASRCVCRHANLGKEIHALSCASKPAVSWWARDTIQESREACGGHGYLAVNKLGVLRDDHDPNCTCMCHVCNECTHHSRADRAVCLARRGGQQRTATADCVLHGCGCRAWQGSCSWHSTCHR